MNSIKIIKESRHLFTGILGAELGVKSGSQILLLTP